MVRRCYNHEIYLMLLETELLKVNYLYDVMCSNNITTISIN